MSRAANLKNRLSSLWCDEQGEVTIEWVVITAMILGMSLAVMTSMSNGTEVLADNIDTELTDREVTTTY